MGMKALLRHLAARLRKQRDGNATLLVALGMPALIGGAGLAVDTAQWYMWKRELQFAADQAAIAGAWSRAKTDQGTDYVTRALQEFRANQAIVDFAQTPTVDLANYESGTANSVVVAVQATRRLPFSSFLTGRAATVAVRAQAAFDPGARYTGCIVALDKDTSGAITIGGNATLLAGCGIAALSTSDSAILVNGNPQVDAGWIITAGGVDDWLRDNTDDDIRENLEGLIDPFADLTPPDNATPRTYACASGGRTTTADVRTTIGVTYTYRRGANLNNALPYIYSPARAPSLTSTLRTTVTVANGTVPGTTASTNTVGTKLSGNGQNTIWEVATTVTTSVVSNVVVTTTSAGAQMQPGTYTSFETRCNTTMAPGVYVIDGGMFTARAQDMLVGNGVMIVLKNGAGIHINGGADVNLTAMTASQLMDAGQSAAAASQLAGMLVFEDPDSPGTNRNTINGNAQTILNGTIYLPQSDLTFSGTASVTSQCLMIAAATITIQGTADVSTFCPPGLHHQTVVASTPPSVNLVS